MQIRFPSTPTGYWRVGGFFNFAHHGPKPSAWVRLWHNLLLGWDWIDA